MKTLTQRLEPYTTKQQQVEKIENKQVLISIMDSYSNTDFRVIIPLKSREVIERAIKVILEYHFIDDVFDQLVADGYIKNSEIETWSVNA